MPKLKNPKAKGNRGEYIVRNLIRGYGWDIKRSYMSGALEFMKGDLVSKDFPFFVEVKNTEKTQFKQWYEKAKTESGPKPPLVAWISNGEPYCFLLLSDLLTLIISGSIPVPKFKKQIVENKNGLQDQSWQKFSKIKQISKLNGT